MTCRGASCGYPPFKYTQIKPQQRKGQPQEIAPTGDFCVDSASDAPPKGERYLLTIKAINLKTSLS